MKVKQLREAIRQIIRKELIENSPAPSKPERETTTLPARPGTKEKPDEKRRTIGNPKVKPKPKAKVDENAMLDKIVSRFKTKTMDEAVSRNARAKYVRKSDKYKYVGLFKDGNGKDEHWVAQGITNPKDPRSWSKICDTEREAAIAADKRLIDLGREPVNILKRK